MTQTPRRTGLSSSSPLASDSYRVAIVGAGTLKGKELADILPESSLLTSELKLLDDDETLGQLEAVGDEVTFVQPVSRDNFDNIDFAFFTSRPEFARRNSTLARNAGANVIDLSYGLEKENGARIRAPWIERELGQTPAPELEPGPVIAAHPAAVVLALLIERARRIAPVTTAVSTIFEPASEYGRSGMDELHEQTVNLLSFQEMPRQVFDVQLAFNLVGRLGEKSTGFALENTQRRILDHYRQIASRDAPVPSIMLVQAPIFHGHVFSVYLELDKAIPMEDFVQALTGDHVTVGRVAEDEPSNVAAAGQEQILISVRQNLQHERGFWLWAAADNLRLHALTAVECAQRLGASRPRRTVQ